MVSKMPIVLVLASVLFGSSVNADDWMHNCMSASDGTSIAVDFRTEYLDHNDVGGPAGTLSRPTWINVKGDSLPSDATVGVSITTFAYDRRLGSTVTDEARKLAYRGTTVRVDLTYNGKDGFTGQASEPLQIGDVTSEYPGSNFYQVMTVYVSHDYWTGTLINPVDQSSSFQFQMSAAGTTSCN